MREWSLEIVLHYPHDRFAVGWQYLAPNEEANFHTLEIFLFITTLTLNIKAKNEK